MKHDSAYLAAPRSEVSATPQRSEPLSINEGERLDTPLAAVVFHEGCATVRCPRCMAVDEVLNAALEDATGDHTSDLRGKYHSWLKRQAIDPETAGGWWSRAALDSANVRGFAQS